MLDKRKIRLMVRMASYEKTNVRQDMKISSYYKKDYASLNTLITILWITIGYAIAGGLFVLCNMDAILKNLTIMKMVVLLALTVLGYIILIVIYGVCASSYYKAKHNRSKQRVKKYYRDMSRLGKYEEKEK